MRTSSDDSFKRPGAVPFKWESQPGVPKHTANSLANTPSSSRPKLQPPPSAPRRHHHHPRSSSASPTRSRRPSSLSSSSTASPSASPSWNRPTAPAVVASHGCFPGAASPLKRRDSRRSNKSKGSRPDQTAAPRSFSAFSAPLGRSSSPAAAEVETRRRSFAFLGPLGMSPRPAAEEDWARRGSPAAFLSPIGRYHRAAEEDWTRRGSPAAFLSPIGRYHRAAEEAVSATRWLF